MSQSVANTKRRLADANLTKTKALPAAGASNASASIDLGSTTLGAAGDNVEVEISLPATPSLADTKSITLTLKDSADDSSFAAITGVSTLVVTGAGGAGASASSRTIRLPSATRRYIRLDATVEGSGGDNTAISTTLKVLAND